MKILVVEDDQTVAQTLQFLLRSYNYAVDIAADGDAGMQMAEAFSYDLILLDVILPKLDGVSLCQQIRSQGIQAPILLLTGQGRTSQKAIALNAGADDYVVKPFDSDELIARIQALLRRGQPTSQPILTWGHLLIDPSQRRVSYKAQLLSVTPKEYAILELFLRNPQKILSARSILDHVWTSLESPGEEAVRVHIKELRHKLTRASAPKDFIKTKHRQGYQLNPQYSDRLATQVRQQPTTLEIAELTAVNDELRVALEKLQVTQEELQLKNEQLEFANRAIEVERQRYQDLFEFAPDAYLVTDLYGLIQEANCAAAVLFQVQVRDLLGQPLLVFIAQSAQSDFCARLNDLNFEPNWELNVKPRSGDSIPVLIEVTKIKGFDSESVGLRWSLCDIRSRKMLEQHLQAARDELELRVAERTVELCQREEFLSSIYNGAAQGVFVLDVIEPNDFRYSDFNFLAEQLAGKPTQDLQGKTPEEAFGEIIGAAFRQNYDRCLQAGTSISYEEHVTLATHSIWTLTTLSPIRDPHGRIYRIVGTAIDISDRKQAEMERHQATVALQKKEEQLRLALDLNAIGMWDWDIAMGSITWNDHHYRLLGYQPGEVEPSYELWRDHVHPDDISDVEQKLAQALANQTDYEAEFRIVLRNGTIRWYLGKGRAIYDQTGQAIRVVGVAFDITDQLQLEADRKQAEIALQQQIEQEKLLADIALDIQRSLRLNDMLSRTVERVREWFNTDRVVIFRFRRDWQGDVIMESVGPDWTPIQSTTIYDPCFSDRYIEPYRLGRIASLDDIDQANLEPCYAELLRSFQVKANLVVPILQNENLWGLLIVHHCRAPRQWQLAEITLLQRLATKVGIAVQQSELYEQTCRELAARTRIQSVLEESEERFRSLSAAAPVGILQANADGICLYSNTHWHQMSGLSVEDSLGNGWLEAVHPDDRKAVSTAWEACLRRIDKGLPEFRLLTPQGETRWVSAQVATMQSATHEIIGYVSTFADITDRKLAETALIESEQRLRTIIDNSPAIIYLIDPHSQHLLVNHSYADLFATNPDDMVGKDLYEFWPVDIADTFAANNRIVFETKNLLQIEETLPLADGMHTYITVKFPLCDVTGTPYAVCGISTDITEKKHLETQFYHAQRLESLGTLAGGIAHDLNNVLTPILAISQLLRLDQTKLDLRAQEMIQVLENSAKRGCNLIKQILTFARGSEGNRSPVRVNAVLQEVIGVIEQTFPKSIRVQQTIPADSEWMVYADSTYLYQVFMNLCVNARDAMPNGGILSFEIAQQVVDQAFAQKNLNAQAGDYVVITVTDTGTGIPPEVRDRIFDPFFTTKPPGQGTGLGLASALGIVKTYGGFLQVSSQIQQGTQVKVYLPTLKRTLSQITPSEEMAYGNGELILIVDDDMAVQQATQTLLENYRYETLTSRDGIEALELYAQQTDKIQVVILDIMMPNMGGIPLTRRLKQINPKIKVIAMSGWLANREAALDAGADIFMCKPYALDELLKHVWNLIHHSV